MSIVSPLLKHEVSSTLVLIRNFRLAFFGPIYAVINLFIHILQNPNSPTIQSDLLLLDIGATHFTHLQLATDSEMAIPFAKDITAFARSAVQYARTVPPPRSPSMPFAIHSEPFTLIPTPRVLNTTNGQLDVADEDPSKVVCSLCLAYMIATPRGFL